MATITNKLAAALRTVDEFCQAGLNSGEPAHMEAALVDAMGITREVIAEYGAAQAAPGALTVWRLAHYGDEVGLYSSLESAKADTYAACAALGFPAMAAVEWRRDGLGTWHSVGIKGWEIDECEVHP